MRESHFTGTRRGRTDTFGQQLYLISTFLPFTINTPLLMDEGLLFMRLPCRLYTSEGGSKRDEEWCVMPVGVGGTSGIFSVASPVNEITTLSAPPEAIVSVAR